VTYILGISSHFHDSAAALVRDGEIIAAAQEERFSRIKADWHFPDQAIAYCLSHLPAPNTPISIAYFENPALKLDRVLHNAARTAPRGAPLWPRTLNMMHDYGHGLPRQLLSVCGDPNRIFSYPITGPMPPLPSIHHHLTRPQFWSSTASANGQPPASGTDLAIN
jgi:carbamoyltransferase